MKKVALSVMLGTIGTLSPFCRAAPPVPLNPASIVTPPLDRTAPAPTLKTAEGTLVPQTIVSPLGKTLALQFNDEFDAITDPADGLPDVDRSKWNTTFWQGSGERTLAGNGEAQYYVDKQYGGAGNISVEKRPNPFSYHDGKLVISATKVPQEMWGNYWMGEQRPFCSGLIESNTHFDFKYGYIEGRFKLPANRGAWPAFWLLPYDPAKPAAREHPWPPEIDIFEAFGHRPDKFTTGIIAPEAEKPDIKLTRWMQEPGVDLSKDFHTWGLAWDERTVVYTFDGKEVSRSNTTPSFQTPMYLLINLAVGGKWYSDEMKAAGTPHSAWEVDETTMPWEMECDYVRVYQ